MAATRAANRWGAKGTGGGELIRKEGEDVSELEDVDDGKASCAVEQGGPWMGWVAGVPSPCADAGCQNWVV